MWSRTTCNWLLPFSNYNPYKPGHIDQLVLVFWSSTACEAGNVSQTSSQYSPMKVNVIWLDTFVDFYVQKSTSRYKTELRLRARQWKWTRFVKSLDQTNNQITNIDHKLAWLESFVKFYVQKSTTSYQTELRLRARQWKWTRFVKSPASRGLWKIPRYLKLCNYLIRDASLRQDPTLLSHLQFLFFTFTFYFSKHTFIFSRSGKSTSSSISYSSLKLLLDYPFFW